ncbi:OLC1v1012330C1 [Oldenlandia corymbosa var. corymbosa]|uniref:OLC1v1012330C1 n=1 Tax=Oldenlandia corymbosa var. corymbosa TaxID=529605 RepID=A0AAV1DYX1_OLDCO|nr:OLC1v1012330C1 [Oldenlandia corymbosa var. corymbosa]
MSEVTIPVAEKLQKTMSEPIKLRRSSTCILGNRSKDNVVPNYLRASIGSCHDLCKFGGKHDFKTIERSPMLKGFVAKPPLKSREPVKDDSVLHQRRRSFSSISRRPSISPLEIHERKDINIPKLSEGLKQKPLRSKDSTMSGTKELRQGNIEVGSTLKETSINSTPGENKRAMRTKKGTKTSNKNKETPLGTATSPESRKNNDARVPKKVPIPRGTKNRTSLATTGSQTPKKVDAKTAPKKLRQVKSKNSLNKARIPQSDDHDDVPEKIIHVIEMNTENSKGQSSELREKQDSPTSNPLPEAEEHIPQKITTLSDNQKTRRAKKDHQSNGSPRKLKFRKGKSIQTEKSNAGSKKLKFKQAKLLNPENADQNAATMRIKIPIKPDMERDQSDETTNNALDEVVLRPQTPIHKEHSQSLYNNVIKERAKKLVKTKSKVKALVDAFETIISLHDEKSQAKTMA